MDRGEKQAMSDADRVAAAFRESARNFETLTGEAGAVAEAARMIVASIRGGGKAIFCGNGGSAADSQHLAAELMGRYLKEREPLPAVALTTDSSALTAIGNDYAFDEIFARQLRGLGRKGDVLIGISTSGNSRNIVAAFEAAKARGIATIALTGAAGGAMRGLADLCIAVPSSDTPRVQEMHIAVGHMICDLVERAF
jgi:D-sedoheptulose 7-phosphate isomerase